MECVQNSPVSSSFSMDVSSEALIERRFVLDYVARVPETEDPSSVADDYESSDYSLSQSSNRRESSLKPQLRPRARSRMLSLASRKPRAPPRPPTSEVNEEQEMELLRKEYRELEKSVSTKSSLETKKERQFKITKRLERALKLEMGDVNSDKETIKSLEEGLSKSRKKLEKIQKAYKKKITEERRMRELEELYSRLLRNHSPAMQPLFAERDSLRQLKKGIRLALQDQTSALSYIGKAEKALIKIEEKLSITKATDPSRLSIVDSQESEYSAVHDGLEQVSAVKLLPYRILTRGARIKALARYHGKSATRQLWTEVNDQYREAMLYAPHLPAATGQEVKNENSLEEEVLLENPPRKSRKISWEDYITKLLEMVAQGKIDLDAMKQWQTRLIAEIRSDQKNADGKLKAVEKKLGRLRAEALRQSSLKL